MASKLPVPRVEVDGFFRSWYVHLYLTEEQLAETTMPFRNRSSAKAAARRWSKATGWPLVIDGKVVKTK